MSNGLEVKNLGWTKEKVYDELGFSRLANRHEYVVSFDALDQYLEKIAAIMNETGLPIPVIHAGDPLKEIRALVKKYVATPDVEIAKSIDEKLKSFRGRLTGGWTDRNVTTLLLDIARY
jgi:hypothetical protein